MLGPPALLVVEALAAEGGVGVLGGDPYDNVAVVAGRGQTFTYRDVRLRPSKGRSGRIGSGQGLGAGCVVRQGRAGVLFGDQRTTLTAWVCLERVARYSTLRSSPVASTCHIWVLVSEHGLDLDLDLNLDRDLDLGQTWHGVLEHLCLRQRLLGGLCQKVRSGPSKWAGFGHAN